jgi:hypothetical protein
MGLLESSSPVRRVGRWDADERERSVALTQKRKEQAFLRGVGLKVPRILTQLCDTLINAFRRGKMADGTSGPSVAI